MRSINRGIVALLILTLSFVVVDAALYRNIYNPFTLKQDYVLDYTNFSGNLSINGDINLNNHSIINVSMVIPGIHDTPPSYVEGARFYLNGNTKKWCQFVHSPDVYACDGADWRRMVNKDSVIIPSCTAVSPFGVQGQRMGVIWASADLDNVSDVIGVTMHPCTVGGECWVMFKGTIRGGCDTTDWTVGDHLYLNNSGDGALVISPLSLPNYNVHIGDVLTSEATGQVNVDIKQEHNAQPVFNNFVVRNQTTLLGNVNMSQNLTVNGGTLIVDSTNNKVGIGTTIPVNKLDVEGACAIGATYSGTSTAPVNGCIIEGNTGIGTSSPTHKLEVKQTSDNNTSGIGILNSAGTRYLKLWVDSSNKGYVETGAGGIADLILNSGAGNVGIGIVSPSQKLQVNGQINALTSAVRGTSVGFQGMDASNLSAYPRAFFYGYSGSAITNFGLYASSGNATGNTQTPAFIGISTNADVKQANATQFLMWRDQTYSGFLSLKGENSGSSGLTNLFIGGTTATGSDALLFINETSKNISLKSYILNIGNYSFSSGTLLAEPTPRIRLDNVYDTTGEPSVNKIVLYDDSTFVSGFGISTADLDLFIGPNGNFKFYTGTTNVNGTGNTEAAVISTTGISTSKNMVATGNISGYTFSTSSSNVGLSDPVVGNGAGTRYILNPSTTNNFGIGLGAIDGTKYPMWFQTGNTNGGGFEWYIGTVEKMRIDKDGNVGIGTSSPSSKLTVNGSANITNDIHVYGGLIVHGNVSMKRPYGTFTSNQSQTLALANTAYPVFFNITEDAYQINMVGNTNFTFDHTGDYQITLSAITASNVANKHVDIWLRKDGVDIPRSGNHLEMANVNAEHFISVQYIIDMNTTNNLQIMWAGDSTGVSLVYTPNSTYAPASPSIVMTIGKWSETTNGG